MKIKELVKEANKSEFKSWTKESLRPDDTIYKALTLFQKCKSNNLPVYENDQYVGLISLVDLANVFFKLFVAERDLGYQQAKKINYSLTKVNSLLKKITGNIEQSIHTGLVLEMEQIINDTKASLR